MKNVKVKVYLHFPKSHGDAPFYVRDIRFDANVSFPFQKLYESLVILYPTAELIAFEMS